MKFINVFAIALILSISIISCSKDDAPKEAEVPFTKQEAVNFFNNSINPNSGGFITNTQNIVEKSLKIVKDNDIDCQDNYTDDYSFDYNGLLIKSNYESNYIFDFDCVGKNFSNTASVSSSSDYSYLSNTLEATSIGNFSGNISGLDTDQENVTLNGAYNHSGKTTTSYIQDRQYDNTTRITFDNITFDKGNPLLGIPPNIKSGSAMISYLFETSSGYKYKFDGDIKFTSARSGEITLNGETFPFGY